AARHGPVGSDLAPEDARCLLDAWRGAVGLRGLDEVALLKLMQGEGFSHSTLFRRACQAHERMLRSAVADATAIVAAGRGVGGLAGARDVANRLFESCVAVVPYAPAMAFLASEQASLDE